MELIFEIFSSIRLLDILDIIVVSFVFYKLLVLIKGTRAEQLIKGLIILMVVSKLSDLAKLYTMHFILDNTMKLGFFALLIVFQPELRRALEYIGRNKFIKRNIFNNKSVKTISIIDEIVGATKYLSSQKIGALIVLEKDTGLGDYISTGIDLNSDISSELLISIFYEKNPLHDGALIIRENSIIAANCYLPLSTKKNLSRELGTRHRAGLGLSEVSDALIIIVSEETGSISLVKEGEIIRDLDSNKLSEDLTSEFDIKKDKKTFLDWLKKKYEVNNE